MNRIFASLLLLLSAGCTTTQLRLHSEWDKFSKPSYEDYFDYYLMAFVGREQVVLQKVCMDQKPYGVEVSRSAEDILIGVYTLGIYTPLTVKVWCGK